MKIFTTSILNSIKLLRQDKIILMLSAIPVAVGSIIYFFLGKWIYSDFFEYAKGKLTASLNDQMVSGFLNFIIGGVITVLLYFIISYSFVLLITIISGPFNDLISQRVEKKILGQETLDLGESFSQIFSSFPSTIVNELKKVSFVILLSIGSFVLSLIPILAPISIIISGLLFSITFLDYSWGRHNFSLNACIKDIGHSPITYTLTGLVGISLMSIPFINLVAYPFSVIILTTQFVEKKRLL